MALMSDDFKLEQLREAEKQERKVEKNRRKGFIESWVNAGGTEKQAGILYDNFARSDHSHPLPLGLKTY